MACSRIGLRCRLERVDACAGNARIGRLMIEAEARAEASGMMVAVIEPMLIGLALSAIIWRLQAYLSR
jgi:hypothetical protein